MRLGSCANVRTIWSLVPCPHFIRCRVRAAANLRHAFCVSRSHGPNRRRRGWRGVGIAPRVRGLCNRRGAGARGRGGGRRRGDRLKRAALLRGVGDGQALRKMRGSRGARDGVEARSGGATELLTPGAGAAVGGTAVQLDGSCRTRLRVLRERRVRIRSNMRKETRQASACRVGSTSVCGRAVYAPFELNWRAAKRRSISAIASMNKRRRRKASPARSHGR